MPCVRIRRDRLTHGALAVPRFPGCARADPSKGRGANSSASRRRPCFASQAVEEIGGGTRIAVVEVVGDWFKVRTAHSHVAGFVRKEFVVPDVFGR